MVRTKLMSLFRAGLQPFHSLSQLYMLLSYTEIAYSDLLHTESNVSRPSYIFMLLNCIEILKIYIEV